MQTIGAYELVEKLATGGMADVHLALQRGGASFVRPVVLKRMHGHLAEQPASCAAFENEGRILALLDHPAIPFVVDYGMDHDVPFLVMQHVPGPTLAEVSAAQNAGGRYMPVDVCLSVAVALADALHHVHECRDGRGREVGLVHMDLAPANVVLRRDGQVGLLDFGIATSARDRSQGPLSGVRGTAGYMAPEQFKGRHELDRRADVFLLGVLLWEMLCGRRLFPEEDLAFYEALSRASLPHPERPAPGLPEELVAIVMRALSRDRDARHATAAELMKALYDFADAHGLSVGPRRVARHVLRFFPVEEVPSYVPHEELGVREVEPLASDANDALALDAGLSDVERRELLEDLELFAEHLEPELGGEAEGDRSAVHDRRLPKPPPVPPQLRRDGAPSNDDDSGVYVQIEPDNADRVF